LLVDGIFVEIGYELDTDWVKHLVKRNKSNEIIIDDRCRTSQPGFFAAGDVSTVPYKQTVISAGEGAKAGLESYKYIKGEDVAIDWK
ncbi:FAD-dependent oxidoreductase, partial [Candidatus Woesearchaeota archaeon]|nr:FAD-dependent oxidoreductase [Candidatus Woesearchaeota archaeon]